MNPELPQVRPGAEATPQIPGGVEYFPDGTTRTVESRPAYSPEQQMARPEAAPQPAPVLPQVGSSQLAAPQVLQPAQAIPPSTSPVSDAPTIAADDDLMEKEWVDKAKKIIALTKGNPYEQAKSIAALQADYLKKRYNRTVGDSKQMAG